MVTLSGVVSAVGVKEWWEIGRGFVFKLMSERFEVNWSPEPWFFISFRLGAGAITAFRRLEIAHQKHTENKLSWRRLRPVSAEKAFFQFERMC